MNHKSKNLWVRIPAFVMAAAVFVIISQNAYADVEVTTPNVIENLGRDTVDTWLPWRLLEGQVLHVNLVNADQFPEKAEVIKNVIISNEAIEIDNSLLGKGPKGSASTYYKGWRGALESASDKKETELYIPKCFEIIASGKEQAEIIIVLNPLKNEDGYTGYTRSITDESQNQIVKSYVTIYNVGNLTNKELETITLHEFGHVMGLAHSSDPEDLMAPIISTDYPYISESDVDAIVGLYDIQKSSQMICEK